MSGPYFNYTRVSDQALLDAIKAYNDEHGYSPSLRELAKVAGCGVTTVYSHLERLAAKGYIKVFKPRRRTILVLKSVIDESDG